MHGYGGKALHIDLGTGASWDEPLAPPVLRAVIGGIGLGTYLLLRHCPAGVDPLGPDNPLIFATSPFAATAITTSAKYAVVTRSPLTGFISDSLSSSHLAIELKRTGYDALVLRGQAATWSVLVIDQGRWALHDARQLLGLTTGATAAAVTGAFGGRAAVIGPAGERLVRYATISNDGRHAGRGGGGAVMGSKRLKAIVARGQRAPSVADTAGLRRANAALIERSLGPATAKYRLLGTPANLLAFDRLGVLPTRNFQQSTFAPAEALSGEALWRTHHTGVTGCASCTVGCEHLYQALDAGPATPTRLEYETVYALGPLLGIGDPNAVLRLARLCDDLGLDSISAGVTLAWAMECAERGLLSPAETDGLALRFGAVEAVPALLQATAARAGLGDLLAEGTRHAAARLGQGSSAWAMHVKGLELPGYEPRGLKTTALGLATAPRGACHNRSAAYEADFSGAVDRFAVDAGRGRRAAETEDTAAVLDSLIVCKFIRACFADLYAEAATLYELVTGWPVTGDELRQAGARITTLKKLFNRRQGWTRADDTLPPRLLEEPLTDGPGAAERLTRAELDGMIATYYAARGWTAEGLPLPATLIRLGLTPDGCLAGAPAGR